MKIGIPRERKPGERRVAVTPAGAGRLVERGHCVFVEAGAGELSGFSDEQYTAEGASIANSLEQVWSSSELLVKVKEPAPEEIGFFRKGLAVFSFLHPAAAQEMTKAMLKSSVIGLDYDLLSVDGRLPILEPMSLIAGCLSIQCGAYALQAGTGGRGVLLGGAPGVPPGFVVVLGAGTAGGAAARTAMGVGAEVCLLDINPDKLAPFAGSPYRARTRLSSQSALKEEITKADLVVGSVLIPGARAPKLIPRSLLDDMKPGSVIVDICIDQGGAAESSRVTSIDKPTFVDSGVVHYCVPNMPALVPRTSTMALTSITIAWIELIAELGVEGAIKRSEAVRTSLVCRGGKIANPVVAKALA